MIKIVSESEQNVPAQHSIPVVFQYWRFASIFSWFLRY